MSILGAQKASVTNGCCKDGRWEGDVRNVKAVLGFMAGQLCAVVSEEGIHANSLINAFKIDHKRDSRLQPLQV
jgi:hypothetical protein